MARTGNKDVDANMHKALSYLLTKLYEIEASLSEYSEPRCRQLLQQRLEEFLMGLQQFKEFAATYKNLQVPTALLSYIDAAGHPDDFVRSLFQQAVVDSQLAAGKVAALQAMQQSLAAAAADVYPEAATAYRTAVEAKQQQQQQQQHQQMDGSSS